MIEFETGIPSKLCQYVPVASQKFTQRTFDQAPRGAFINSFYMYMAACNESLWEDTVGTLLSITIAIH